MRRGHDPACRALPETSAESYFIRRIGKFSQMVFDPQIFAGGASFFGTTPAPSRGHTPGSTPRAVGRDGRNMRLRRGPIPAQRARGHAHAHAHTAARTHAHGRIRPHAHTHTRTHAHTHTRPHAHAHARTRTHTAARTRTHTHTHAHAHAHGRRFRLRNHSTSAYEANPLWFKTP